MRACQAAKAAVLLGGSRVEGGEGGQARGRLPQSRIFLPMLTWLRDRRSRGCLTAKSLIFLRQWVVGTVSVEHQTDGAGAPSCVCLDWLNTLFSSGVSLLLHAQIAFSALRSTQDQVTLRQRKLTSREAETV